VAYNNTVINPGFQKIDTTYYILGALTDLLYGIYWEIDVDNYGTITVSKL
jgi:hypothetical protein